MTILAKYADFANNFVKKLAQVLPKQISINKLVIKLGKDKQRPYKSIYSLDWVENRVWRFFFTLILLARKYWFINGFFISLSNNGFIRHIKFLSLID